jgi:hypothetical protein
MVLGSIVWELKNTSGFKKVWASALSAQERCVRLLDDAVYSI